MTDCMNVPVNLPSFAAASVLIQACTLEFKTFVLHKSWLHVLEYPTTIILQLCDHVQLYVNLEVEIFAVYYQFLIIKSLLMSEREALYI